MSSSLDRVKGLKDTGVNVEDLCSLRRILTFLIKKNNKPILLKKQR